MVSPIPHTPSAISLEQKNVSNQSSMAAAAKAEEAAAPIKPRRPSYLGDMLDEVLKAKGCYTNPPMYPAQRPPPNGLKAEEKPLWIVKVLSNTSQGIQNLKIRVSRLFFGPVIVNTQLAGLINLKQESYNTIQKNYQTAIGEKDAYIRLKQLKDSLKKITKELQKLTETKDSPFTSKLDDSLLVLQNLENKMQGLREKINEKIQEEIQRPLDEIKKIKEDSLIKEYKNHNIYKDLKNVVINNEVAYYTANLNYERALATNHPSEALDQLKDVLKQVDTDREKIPQPGSLEFNARDAGVYIGSLEERFKELKQKIEDEIAIQSSKIELTSASTSTTPPAHQAYFEKFNQLVNCSKLLTEGDISKRLKLVFSQAEGKFIIKTRNFRSRIESRIKPKDTPSSIGKSERAKNTAREVINLLNKGLENRVFKEHHLTTIKFLKQHLAQQLGAFSRNTALKEDFDNIFERIEASISVYAKLAIPVTEINGKKHIDLANLNKMYDFLLKPEEGKQFREDFLTAGKWLFFIKKDEEIRADGLGKNIGALVDKMKEKFISPESSLADKDCIIQFATGLLQRKFIQPNANEPNVFQFILDSDEKLDSVKRFEEVKGANVALVNANTILSHLPVEVKEKQPIDILNNTIAAKLKLIAQGDLKDENDFKNRLMHDLSVICEMTFTAIDPSELYNLAWVQKNNDVIAPNVMYNAHNLNQIAYFVNSQILLQPDLTLAQRARMYEFFINIAYEYAMRTTPRDYHLAMSIYASSNQAAANSLINLAKDKEAFNPTKEFKKKYDALKTLFNHELSYKQLREAQRKTALHIPYVGCYLTDLTFTSEGNPDIKDGQINFNGLGLFGKTHQISEKTQEELKKYIEKNPQLNFDTYNILINTPTGDERDNVHYAAKNRIKNEYEAKST